MERLCFLVISQGTAAVPAVREVRCPGWNLAQRRACCKERSCPNHAGLCKEATALKDTWSSCNNLYGQITGYLHPQTLILPSTRYPLSIRAPIRCIHLVLGKDTVISAGRRSHSCLSQTPRLNQTPHLVRMARKIDGQFLHLGIPDLQRAVTAPAHQQAAVG